MTIPVHHPPRFERPGPEPELITRRRVHLLRTARCWFPASAWTVLETLRTHDIVTATQCSAAIARRLAPLAFSARPLVTTIVDLDQSDDDLLEHVSRNCRRDLTWGRTLDAEILVNEQTDEARGLINAAIARQRWRPQLTDEEWGRLLEHGDVFLLRREGNPLVAHVVLDAPRRAQLQLTATALRGDGGDPDLGPLNRQLHWFEFGHYRDRERREYDFGGLVLDPAHRLAGASRFKRSFGGEVVTEYVVRLARSRVLRGLLAHTYHGDDDNPAMNAADDGCNGDR